MCFHLMLLQLSQEMSALFPSSCSHSKCLMSVLLRGPSFLSHPPVLFRNITSIKLSSLKWCKLMSCKNSLRHSLKPAAMSALYKDAVSGLYPSPPCKSFSLRLCCCYSSFEDHNKANGLSCKKEPEAEPRSTSIKPIETSLRLFLSPACSHPSSSPIFLFSREQL